MPLPFNPYSHTIKGRFKGNRDISLEIKVSRSILMGLGVRKLGVIIKEVEVFLRG